MTSGRRSEGGRSEWAAECKVGVKSNGRRNEEGSEELFNWLASGQPDSDRDNVKRDGEI